MIRVVIFDFGGVLAEEGFREGLMAIAVKNNLDPDEFFRKCEEIIYETGYVKGLVEEHHYWDTVRQKTGLKGNDKELRNEILNRFILRPKMFECVKKLREEGFMVCILSDQTNWLDEINERTPFYQYFDFIFNSYKIRISKRDSNAFSNICSKIGVINHEALFIDDNIRNIKAAESEGLKTIHFIGLEDFEKKINAFLDKRH